jgi:hypothetical protein
MMGTSSTTPCELQHLHDRYRALGQCLKLLTALCVQKFDMPGTLWAYCNELKFTASQTKCVTKHYTYVINSRLDILMTIDFWLVKILLIIVHSIMWNRYSDLDMSCMTERTAVVLCRQNCILLYSRASRSTLGLRTLLFNGHGKLFPRGTKFTTQLNLVSSLRMYGAIHLFHHTLYGVALY